MADNNAACSHLFLGQAEAATYAVLGMPLAANALLAIVGCSDLYWHVPADH